MRKKELLKLYENAYKEIQRYTFELEDLRLKNSELNALVSKLAEENNVLKAKEFITAPAITEEKYSQEKPKTTPDRDYAARAIGRIVVLATRHCSELTASTGKSDVKELINLILGRTEVAKAEILKIVNCDSQIDAKTELIDSEVKSAEEYFINIRAQI